MKLSTTAATLYLSALAMVHAEGDGDDHHHDDDECTHGMLYVSGIGSSNVKSYDLSKGLDNLSVKDTIAVPGVGTELTLSKDSTSTVVSVIYRGQLDQLYQDGYVRWINTGRSVHMDGDEAHIESDPPSLIDNAAFDCARAIHYVPHDDKIAIFCDGIITNTTLVNTTIWVVDETLFGDATQSAIVFQTTLESSHHGVAIPVDDNHIMYSLPTPERLAGDVSRATALPGTFQVTDYDGIVLHALEDTSSMDTSCAGFHGSWAKDNTFVLACDDSHGGVLVVDYDSTAATYKSRALSYPSEYPGHRTGSFAEHHMAPLVVGNFAGADKSHLVAFDPLTDSVLSSNKILSIGEKSQCSYLFELSEGQLLLVLTPDGMFSVYQVSPEWKKLASKVIIEGMESCDDVMMVAGYGQAFVMDESNQKLYAIDLPGVMQGNLEVSESTLDFTPYSATVAGVPEGMACKLSDEFPATDSHSGAYSTMSFAVTIACFFTIAMLW